MHPISSGTVDERPGLVIHVLASNPADLQSAVRGALRSAANARADLPPGTPIHVLVQGPAVTTLRQDSDLGPEVEESARAGTDILACANSLASTGVSAAELMKDVAVVPAAIGHLTRQQWRGWAYARL